MEMFRENWYYKTQRNTGSASSGIERVEYDSEGEEELVGDAVLMGRVISVSAQLCGITNENITAPDLEHFLTAAWAARTVTPKVAAAAGPWFCSCGVPGSSHPFKTLAGTSILFFVTEIWGDQTGTHERVLFRVGMEEQAADYKAERIACGAMSVQVPFSVGTAACATGTETIPRNNDFAPKVWGDPNDAWCSKCRVLDTLEINAINRAQHFGDEMSDPAGYMDIEDRGRNVTWAGIARGKRGARDGRVESGSLQQQVVKMAAMALETSMQCVGELEKLRAQITEQEATAQRLRIELATLRSHANEEFAAICLEIEAVRSGIADAFATAVWRTKAQFSKFTMFLLANLASLLQMVEAGVTRAVQRTIAEKFQLENVKGEESGNVELWWWMASEGDTLLEGATFEYIKYYEWFYAAPAAVNNKEQEEWGFWLTKVLHDKYTQKSEIVKKVREIHQRSVTMTRAVDIICGGDFNSTWREADRKSPDGQPDKNFYQPSLLLKWFMDVGMVDIGATCEPMNNVTT
ncbi:hypothetical protein BJ742DRAFT_745114 [Cladochytrium replicatum]|nr:hypothetical protein BJ742DRAFT_745114 [Cladochytrium replicatum]